MVMLIKKLIITAWKANVKNKRFPYLKPGQSQGRGSDCDDDKPLFW